MNAWVFHERGQIVQFTSNYIGKLERGVFRWPSKDCRAGLRAVLGVATDAELGFRPPDRGVGAATIEADRDAPTLLAGEEVDDVLRRTFLRNASLTGVGTALGLELTRHGLNQLMPEGAATDLADWHDVVREYGEVYRDGAVVLSRLSEMLVTDLLGLQATISQTSKTGRRLELYKIGALLSHYMAQTVRDLGHRTEAARWWRTARYAADSSGDSHIMLYIRGRAAIRDIYDGRPPNLIIDAVNETEELMAKGPVAGRPSLLAARAQSFAMLGRADEAETDLEKLRDTFAALPPDMTRDHGAHCWAYPEERIRFTESFVYSYLGNLEAAEQAQQTALRLYPPVNTGGRLGIELQRALCHVRTGDSTEGARHATATLEVFPAESRTRFEIWLGEQVLAAIPPDERGRTASAELHEAIRSNVTADRHNETQL
ncbi:hypothetical protein [Nocardia pneumoniae]|uniref:hypothetical protein n=1 Tax=Nocardia pneumoniae TaxID=228601 RepID=UPI000594B065|nr:hypothetical protein [Nocardia pneumoniae]